MRRLKDNERVFVGDVVRFMDRGPKTITNVWKFDFQGKPSYKITLDGEQFPYWVTDQFYLISRSGNRIAFWVTVAAWIVTILSLWAAGAVSVHHG